MQANVKCQVQKVYNVILNLDYAWLVLSLMASLKNKSKFINSIDMALHSWKQTEELHHAAITKSICLKY